ncbi:hypothetical protein ACQPW1_09885 [Nocardia sp. CA-128927]|uniref:hypothetical protein n=1 Tax=Nocardia sp. CA-128927 TaxID=3239975 RepID=UPI003D97F04C
MSNPKSVTTEAWLNRWIDEIHRSNVVPITHARYSRIIQRHFNPSIGHIALGELTIRDLGQTCEQVSDALATPAEAYRILRAALVSAVENGVIDHNVAGQGAL